MYGGTIQIDDFTFAAGSTSVTIVSEGYDTSSRLRKNTPYVVSSNEATVEFKPLVTLDAQKPRFDSIGEIQKYIGNRIASRHNPSTRIVVQHTGNEVYAFSGCYLMDVSYKYDNGSYVGEMEMVYDHVSTQRAGFDYEGIFGS